MVPAIRGTKNIVTKMRLLFVVIALTFSYSVDAFNTIASNISPSMRTTTQRRHMSFLRMSDLRDNSADEDTSYDGASSDLQKQGEKEYDAMFDDSDDEVRLHVNCSLKVLLAYSPSISRLELLLVLAVVSRKKGGVVWIIIPLYVGMFAKTQLGILFEASGHSIYHLGLNE